MIIFMAVLETNSSQIETALKRKCSNAVLFSTFRASFDLKFAFEDLYILLQNTLSLPVYEMCCTNNIDLRLYMDLSQITSLTSLR